MPHGRKSGLLLVVLAIFALTIWNTLTLAAPQLPLIDSAAQMNVPRISAQSVSGGVYHACAIDMADQAFCWGNNAHGELNAPAGDFVHLSAKDHHTCGLKTDDTVVCWGWNNDGRLDVPPGTYLNVAAGGMTEFGFGFNCAVKATDNTLICWGTDTDNIQTVPVGTFTGSIGAGDRHACAVKTDNTVVCWGLNADGQNNVPVGEFFTQVDAAGYHSCGLKTDKSIACWGFNGYGQTNAPLGNDFQAVETGENNSCGLKDDGTIVCWGYNGYGQNDVPAGTYKSVSDADTYTCAITTGDALICWGNVPGGGAPTETPTETATSPATETPTVTSTPDATGTATSTPDATATATSTAVPGTELLSNNGFEAKQPNSKPDLAPWTVKHGAGEKIKCKPGVPNSGECAFRFKGGTLEHSKLIQVADLSAITPTVGDNLDLSLFMVGANATGKVKLKVKYNDSTPTGRQKVPVAGMSVYTELTAHYALESADVKSIMVQITSKSTSGKTFVDDVSLIYTTAANSAAFSDDGNAGLIPLP
ncbi:MAG TPA: hypothetical protein VHL11_24880 [Phototrophicaceae bacterium]|nr:hypothetical protein [Phototrophicaceae bacterium]